MTKVRMRIISFTAIILLGLFIIFIGSQCSAAYSIPDTPETREIIAALEHAYDVLAVPFDTLDVNKLAEVFIDDPIFLERLTQEQRSDAQNRVRIILGADVAKDFGYLTAMKAKRIHQQHGAQLLKAALANANSTQQDFTQEEWQQLEAQNYGERPYLPDLSLPGRFPLQIQTIELDGDKAYVRYDDGPALQEAILVRINKQWFVAGIIPINVHF